MATKYPELNNLLGARIKEIRIKNGYITAEQFAYKHGFPKAQYVQYEQGDNVNIPALHKILKIHKMTFHQFFSEGFGEY